MKYRNKIVIIIAFILMLIVSVCVYIRYNSQNNDHVYDKKNMAIQQNKILGEASDMSNNSVKGSDKDEIFKDAPQWVKSLIEINDNPLYTREYKIEKLIELLKNNQTDNQAIESILTSLMKYNPIEVADEIIPYLKNNNPRVQSTAVGTLNSAASITEKEYELKQPLPENEAKRQRIAQAINELKNNSKTTEDVRLAIISNYAGTNPSVEDTRQMTKEIVSQSMITDNEAAYLATTLLNGQNVESTLTALNTKDAVFKERVISYMGNNIMENPATATIPSQQQKNALSEFVQKNPPVSKDEDFGAKNDQWKNTLNVLNNQN